MQTQNLTTEDESVFTALDNTPVSAPYAPPPPPNDPFDLDIPPEALYGYLGDVARSTQTPLSWTYPAALAFFAGRGINMQDDRTQVHPTLFVMLMGPPESGKSRTSNRILDSLVIPEENIRRVSPSSDRGLINLFAPGKTQKGEEPDDTLQAGVIRLNEMRTMMKKMNIEGSSLGSTLCDVWDGDRAGVVDKQGTSSMHARVSIVGNMPVAEPSELHEVMTNESTKGLYSRMILCPGPTDWNWDDEWAPTVKTRHPVAVTIPPAVFAMKKEWVDTAPEGVKRGRIAELALRVAVISSSANWEKVVTPACMAAALRFAEWQESVRLVYTPSLAMDARARISVEITAKIDLFAAPGEWFRWSQFIRAKNLDKKYDAEARNRLKNALVAEGILDAEMDTSSSRPQPTGMYRTITDKVLADKAEDRRAREMEREEREAATPPRFARFAPKPALTARTTEALAKFAEKTKIQEAA